MIAYREEKVINAICYFATEHYRRTKRYIRQTLLYKFLGFLEFESVEKKGKPVLELTFSAYEKGPVPPEIMAKRDNYDNECFSFVHTGGNCFNIIPKADADLSFFSKFEIELMDKILRRYSREELSNKKMIDMAIADSHEIKSWKEARKRLVKKMKYQDMFPGIGKKSEEDLTPEEESFLIYDALRKKSYDNRRCTYLG
jgi:hypothetical protein